LTILHEDATIIVVDKAPGLLTIGTDREKDKTAHFLLNEYVKKGNPRSRNRVYVVHRLDRETSGILVFAKSETAKTFLQENWSEFSKSYLALVHGILKEKEGEIVSYLFENKAFRVFSTKDESKGKLSKTGFKVLKESKGLSLLEIQLFTGRKHQIRVHLSEKGNPVVGDKMYGRDEKGKQRLALHSASLKLVHPETKKEISFKTGIPDAFKSNFK
jgi:tRNA pseudouridine32 synthase/23S rRNA pseudouridine746 synthase/23S rRNA pseudouridine1911/1915/1917 synthase